MYRAMPEERWTGGKNASTRRAKPDKEVHFFLQSPPMRTLPDVNYFQKIVKIK